VGISTSVGDVPKDVPAESTLTGLAVFDTYGTPARMDPTYFTPRHSHYAASVEPGSSSARLVASKNDPEAELEMRVNGQEWVHITSGVNSYLQAVPVRGWLLLEVRAISPTASAAGFAPVVYQVTVTQQALCHERCRSCFGPGAQHCLRCRAPFVMYEGRCEATACPPDGYYEWRSYQCKRCDASCASCMGRTEVECTLCPALFFLSPQKWEDLSGPCVGSCPNGTFAHPGSRRCRLPPAVAVKAFYIRLLFRMQFHHLSKDTRLQESIVNTTAFVLDLSLSDVRLWQLDGELTQGRVSTSAEGRVTIEVVSPFLAKADVNRILIDAWFGAFEVPVDRVTTHTWDEMHPPPPTPPVLPLIPPWLWGVFVAVVTTLMIIVPLYTVHFRRLANTKKRFKSGGRFGRRKSYQEMTFVPDVVDKAPAWLVRRFVAKEAGERFAIRNEDDDKK